ncbi:MAG: response regulator transcription factor [Pedobacter sp.]|nr:response regulator transcription factor [Pedobacter sp.]
MTSTLLVVEDEADLREFLCTTLHAHGYEVHAAASCAEARQQFEQSQPDLVLLDLGLPDGDGRELLVEFRQEAGNMPVLVLSARDQEEEKIAALDEGAEDYLTKPFSTGELLARLRVLLRRGQQGRPQEYALGGLFIDVDHHAVTLDGRAVHLTPIEFDLLAALARGEGRVMTHASLMLQVWGKQMQENTHYLRIYMRQLRSKLEADPTQPRYLKTVPGVGYCLAMER